MTVSQTRSYVDRGSRRAQANVGFHANIQTSVCFCVWKTPHLNHITNLIKHPSRACLNRERQRVKEVISGSPSIIKGGPRRNQKNERIMSDRDRGHVSLCWWHLWWVNRVYFYGCKSLVIHLMRSEQPVTQLSTGSAQNRFSPDGFEMRNIYLAVILGL